MFLPNQLELQTLFSGFLFEAGLSSVSVKNYLSDLRNFLSFCASISSHDDPPTVQEIFQNINKFLDQYVSEQKRSFTPQNTLNRRLASIRRFSTFLDSKFGLSETRAHPHPSAKNILTVNSFPRFQEENAVPTIEKILDHFKHFLEKEKKTHSTVKNYISDLNHFFAWSANSTPFMDQDFENILSISQLEAYVTYLRLSHTSTSVINRRQSSIKQFTKYCFLQKYLPNNPFEYKHEAPRLAPLSWLDRLVTSKDKKKKKASKSRLATWYQKYNSLPFTPYLHLAILALATSAMVIFGYNQIIKQAFPSSAALPTVPRRQLSFQGRLTDSSGTPITTSVSVTFKLWNDLTAGSQLYTSGACSITPDGNGIFNTLIGDGVCGSEIANTVFTENRDVFLEVIIGADTLTPRQQIATVGYALNSETLQGYPASGSATANTIAIVDASGNINIAAPSPSIISSSGVFTIEGQALTLTTTSGSGGNIIIQPDAIGAGQVQILGATTNTDTLRIENANLTSGALISGYVGNDSATGRLLSLTAGSTETDRFYVAASGQTSINTNATLANAALIVNQNGTGDIFTASASGTTKFTIANNGNITATGTLTGLTGLTVVSGTVSLPNGQINNAEISELDWTKLQNYPAACPAGQAIQQVGDTLTCIDISATSGNLWQRTSGSLAPINITDSLNLGDTATSSALVHLAGTAGENSWINTGNFGIGTTTPTAKLDVAGDASTSGSLIFYGSNPSTIDVLNGNRLDFQTSPGGDAGLVQIISVTNIGLGIGLTNPVYKLDLTGDFNIASGGIRAGGSFGISGQVLSSTGTGVQWINAATGGGNSSPWDWNTGVIFPFSITDAVNLGNSATASATVHLAGTAGDNSFINTGNFGIGLTNPGTALDVVGVGRFSTGLTLTGGALNLTSTSGAISSTGLGASTISTTSNNLTLSTVTSGTLALTSAGALNLSAGAASTWTLANVTNSLNIDSNTLVIDASNNRVGIGLTNPAYTLDISGDMNLTGALNASGNPGTPGQILSSTGTAVQWIDPTAGSAINQGWTWAAGVLYPTEITDAVNLGSAATASATVHLAGTPGDNSFINTGYFGVGTTTPTAMLDVAGDASTSGSLVFRGSNSSTIDVLNGNRLDFQTSPGGDAGLTPKMTLTNDGKLGIGVTNPVSALSVGTGSLFQVDSSGAIVAATGITNTGIITSTGGIINLNASSNFATNINTGTSTGAVSIGGGSNTVAINSSSWGIDTLGAATGFTGIVSSGNIDFSSLAAGGMVKADITTGRLSVASGGTDFEFPLTFSNGLTRSVNSVTLGGTLTGNTDIPLAGYNFTLSGIGNVGIGVTTPSQKLDVSGFFVVDTTNSRVGIGTTTPTATLDIAGATSTISNSTGNITINAASGYIDFSGDSLANFLNATASGQIVLGNFTDGARPTPLGAGSLIYSTTQNNPQYYDGSNWNNIGNYWQRTAGSLAPYHITDSLNLGSTATSSALVHLAGTVAENSFINTGFFGIGKTNPTSMLQVEGDIYPGTGDTYDLGTNTLAWDNLTLNTGINYGSTQKIAIGAANRLAGGNWNVSSGNLRIGDTTAATDVTLYVVGNATVSGTLQVGATMTVGGGSGKIDVGTVDPPYTINGTKYATYMASMVGIKEETVGKVTTTSDGYINGLGYRTLLDLDQQPEGSDLWLFSQTTNIQSHINDLSVLLTPEGQAKAWYEVDKPNKILAIYSSTPTNITYRLSAPRFDSYKWTNIRTSQSVGHVINDNNVYTNTNSIFDNPVTSPELVAKVDGTYSLLTNGVENKEVASFMKGIIANLEAGAAVVANLVTDNLTVRTKLISPLADIEKLNATDATISGTLYANNIKSDTVDHLRDQINLLDSKYSTASSILADLQAKYGTYDALLGATSSATIDGDPLALSPLATTSAIIPSDLTLNSLNVHTLIANDLLANGSIFTKSISAFDTDLYIQPTGDKLVYISNNLMVLYPDGKVVINGDLLVTGTIFAQGLDTKTATVSGTLAVGSSTIATQSANFDRLTTNGLVIASGNDPLATVSGQTGTNATIGTSTILSGTSEISIINTKITPTTLIYVTPTSDTKGKVLYVKSKQAGVGFTVSLAGTGNNNSDISFNYWLVETK